MDYLQEAKDKMSKYSGKVADLQVAAVYVGIAQADRMDKLIAELGVLTSKVDALLKQGQPEAKTAKPKVVRRKTTIK